MSIVEGLQQAGPYQIMERLGSNGVVATFRGSDVNRGNSVCVVAMAESDLETAESWPAFQELFNRLVTNPPGKIVRPIQCGQMPGVNWAAYEFVDGLHAGEAVRDSGLPSPGQALHIVARTVEALEVLHDSGSIHGAITPASIFISSSQDILLHHVGWSAMILSVRGGAKNAAFASNLPFLAPEVVASGQASQASDVYSIGANLYFLLTGQPIFWADTVEGIVEMIANGQPDFEKLAAAVPGDVAELVEELLEPDPDDRPLNLAALRPRIESLAEHYASLESAAHDSVADEPNEDYASIGSEETVHGVVPPSAPVAVPPPIPSAAPPSVPTAAPPPLAASAPPPAPPLAAAATPPPPPAASAPAPMAVEERTPGPRPAKKGGGGKVIVMAGLGIVFLAVVVGALMLFMGGGEAEDAPGPGDVAVSEDGAPGAAVAPAVSVKRTMTEKRLAEMGRIQKRYALENGIWASTMEELKAEGAADEITLDAWGNEFDIRQSYLVSAGADGKWETGDELWVDAESGILGP